MDTELIENAYKIKIGRNRTQITTYENMQLVTSQPIKKDKPKKIKPNIPSDYAEFNYYNRMKQRRKIIKELCYNNFEIPNAVMLTLTFDAKQSPEKSFADLKTTHREFKKFIQRVNSHYQDFRYISTFSRQTNGNWHYHVMCNFSHDITNEEIRRLWGNGITYVSYVKETELYQKSIQYLLNNMDESADALKSKHGYLCSRNMEKDIELTSWRSEHHEEFMETFEKVNDNKRKILYESRNPIGIYGEKEDEETGEKFRVIIPDREINDALKEAGYESLDTVYTHLSSAARFPEKFSELKAATPKAKKFKRNSTGSKV